MTKKDTTSDSQVRNIARKWLDRKSKKIKPTVGEVQWEMGKIILNEYRVKDILGTGAMGIVYLVQHISDSQLFAVKTLSRAALQEDGSERLFLQEVRTWMELPEHPHLNGCLFFRTVEQCLAIFAEYVDGGSLQIWLIDEKLETLAQILDVAIQIAWGLHAAHENGVIHQDIKPANILLTKDGTAKITDFGLARARRSVGLDSSLRVRTTSLLVSCGGLTPAYCSPEQAMNEKLSSATDVWSYGITLFEMFVSRVIWRLGTVAPMAFRKYIATGGSRYRPAIPGALVQVIEKCFHNNPQDRWSSMLEIATELQAIYKDVTESAYPRQMPKISRKRIAAKTTPSPVAGIGDKGGNPERWLERALEISGLNLNRKSQYLPASDLTGKAQTLADLEVFDVAKRIFVKLVEDEKRDDLKEELSKLLLDKAQVHVSIDDLPGALEAFDEALVVLERLHSQHPRDDLTEKLGHAYLNKAILHRKFNDYKAAITVVDDAKEIFEQLLQHKYRPDLEFDLARILMNKAVILQSRSELDDVPRFFDDAIEIMDRICQSYQGGYRSSDFALCLMKKGDYYRVVGSYTEAITCYDRSIEISETMVYRQGRKQFKVALADVYLGKAQTLTELGRYSDAVILYNNLVDLVETLVFIEGHNHLRTMLGSVYMNIASVMKNLNLCASAQEFSEKAVSTFEYLVQREGRNELRKELAKAYLNQARVESFSGRRREALPVFEKAIGIWESLICQHRYSELFGDLAMACAYKAGALLACGNMEAARNEASHAISVLQTVSQETHRADVKQTLDWASGHFRMLLDAPDERL